MLNEQDWIKKHAEIAEISFYDVVRIEVFYINEDGDIIINRDCPKLSNNPFHLDHRQLNDSGSFTKSYRTWIEHFLGKNIYGWNSVAFRKAFTLAWSRSDVTDKNDHGFCLQMKVLDTKQINSITIPRYALSENAEHSNEDLFTQALCEDIKKKDKEIARLNRKVAALEKQTEELMQRKRALGIDNENTEMFFGPYKLAQGKKTDFIKIIYCLFKMNFFVKQKDDSYATNRADVIDSMLVGNSNTEQLLPKALKTNTFMNIFHKLLDKASEIYNNEG